MWSSVQLMHLNYTLNHIFGAGTKWGKNLNGPKIFPQNVEQCAAHASKLHIQLDFRCRNTTKQKSIWILTHSVQLMHPKLHIQLDFWCRNITEQKSIWIFDFNTLFLWLIILMIFFIWFVRFQISSMWSAVSCTELTLLQLQKDLVPFLASYIFRHTCRMQRYKIDSWKCEPFSIMWFIKDFSMYSKVGYCHSAVIIWGQKNMKLNFKI